MESAQSFFDRAHYKICRNADRRYRGPGEEALNTVSVCLIAKDEAETIARVLRSAAPFADELIVVDTGSTDETAAIAAANGAIVELFAWVDDFSAARNFAFSLAHGNYLMWLDADDVVPEASAAEISAAKARNFDGADTLMLPYHLAFSADGQPTAATVRERILRRCSAAKWIGAVHEVIVPFGRIASLDAPIEHRKLKPGAPGRNLRIYEKMLENGQTLSQRERFYYARELCDNGKFAEAEPIFSALLAEIAANSPDRGALYRGLAACCDHAADPVGALRWLLAAGENGCPSAVTCYAIGERFFARGLYRAAADWYKAALREDCAPETFDSPVLHTLYPCLQLAVCFDRLGEYERAASWNERALAFAPDDPSARQNAAYFARILPR